jgi:hypothetical protein
MLRPQLGALAHFRYCVGATLHATAPVPPAIWLAMYLVADSYCALPHIRLVMGADRIPDVATDRN